MRWIELLGLTTSYIEWLTFQVGRKTNMRKSQRNKYQAKIMQIYHQILDD